jgi:hypothetical protein
MVESWWQLLLTAAELNTRRGARTDKETRKLGRISSLVLAHLSATLPEVTVVDMPHTRHIAYNWAGREKYSISLPPVDFWLDVYARLAILGSHIDGTTKPCIGLLVCQSRHAR